jgi:hypothetical protein
MDQKDRCNRPLPWLTLQCELRWNHTGRHQAKDPKDGATWHGGWNGPWCAEQDAEKRTCLLPRDHGGDHRFTV